MDARRRPALVHPNHSISIPSYRVLRRFRRRRDDDNVHDAHPPLFVLLGSFLLYFLRFGYDYANSDQDEVIPYVLHRMDPGLFTQDWFVNTQISEFSVRTYFVWLLNAFSLILPLWLTTLFIYVVTWLFLGAAIYKLAFHITRDSLAASASVLVALVLTPLWTLGGNDLVHSMLVASMVAWALGLWAVYHFLRGRFLLAPVLLGVACWIQALVGLHLAILLVAIRLYRILRREPGPNTIGGVLVFGGLFVLWSSPALGPLVYQELFALQEPLSPEPSLFYILAQFRLPHHYLPGSFYLHSWTRFGLLTVLGLGVLLSARYRRGLESLPFVVRSLAFIAALCIFATIFTELHPTLLIAKLQLFKTTVFAKLLLVILVTGAACYVIPSTIRTPLQEVIRWPRIGLAVVLVIWIGVGVAAVHSNGPLRDWIGPFRRAAEPIGYVQNWANRSTNPSAIFAVPPSYSSFRSGAQRTIVINHKAIPFNDADMVTWFNRLMDMAPIDLPRRGGPETLSHLDSAFAALSAEDLMALAERYRFEYVVRPTALIDLAKSPEVPVIDEDTLIAEGSFQDDDTTGELADAEDQVEAPDTAAAVRHVRRRQLVEVFRADELHVYRLITPTVQESSSE